MGKRRARSLSGPEIVNSALCSAHHERRLLPQPPRPACAPPPPARFRSASEYFSFIQTTVLDEARALISDALRAREGRRERAGVMLRLGQLHHSAGRPLASLQFCVMQRRARGDVRGGGGPAAVATSAFSDLRPGGVFLLRPQGGTEILAVVDGRSSSPAEPVFEVNSVALASCGEGLGGGVNGSDIGEQAERSWEAWYVASVLVSQRCVDVCQRRPSTQPILNSLLGGVQSTHIRFDDSDDENDCESCSDSGRATDGEQMVAVGQEKAKDGVGEHSEPLHKQDGHVDEIGVFHSGRDASTAFAAHTSGLNSSQCRAMHEMLAQGEGLSLVQGPPGTGKTRLLVGLLLSLASTSAPGAGTRPSRPSAPRSRDVRGRDDGTPTGPRVIVCAPSNKAVLELLLRFVRALGHTLASRDVALVGDAEKLVTDAREAAPYYVYDALGVAAARLEELAGKLGALSNCGFCSEEETRRLVRIAHTAPCQRRARRWASVIGRCIREIEDLSTFLRTRTPRCYGAGFKRPLAAVLASTCAVLRSAGKALEVSHWQSTRRDGCGVTECSATEATSPADAFGPAERADCCAPAGHCGRDDILGQGSDFSSESNVHSGSGSSSEKDEGDEEHDGCSSDGGIPMTWPCARREVDAHHLASAMLEAATAVRAAAVETGTADELLLSARFVFCTCCVAGSHIVRQLSGDVSWLVLDEASQASEPEALIPFGMLPRRTIVCGDPRQLSPMALTRAMQRTLMDRLMLELGQPHHFLDTQYRMHPAISAFPAKFFYDGRLRNGPSTVGQGGVHAIHRPSSLHKSEVGSSALARAKKASRVEPLQAVADDAHRGSGWLGPLSLLDVCGVEEKTASGSLFNKTEVHAVTTTISFLRDRMGIDAACASQLKVLTFYSAQVAAIRRSCAERGLPGVFVSTVDGAQGAEAAVVILSFVRARGALGFLHDQRRLNVGITRAQRALLMFAHVPTLAGGAGGFSATAALVRHAADVGQIYAWNEHLPRRLAADALAPIRALASRAPAVASSLAMTSLAEVARDDDSAADGELTGNDGGDSAPPSNTAHHEIALRVQELQEFVKRATKVEEEKRTKRQKKEVFERMSFRPPTLYHNGDPHAT